MYLYIMNNLNINLCNKRKNTLAKSHKDLGNCHHSSSLVLELEDPDGRRAWRGPLDSNHRAFDRQAMKPGIRTHKKENIQKNFSKHSGSVVSSISARDMCFVYCSFGFLLPRTRSPVIRSGEFCTQLGCDPNFSKSTKGHSISRPSLLSLFAQRDTAERKIRVK